MKLRTGVLNQESHGTLRLLSERECALSVANTVLFNRVLKLDSTIPLRILEDTFSFVPKRPHAYDCGMSYRALPDFLNPKPADTLTTQTYTVPLLAFYGQHNADFFKQVVRANGNNATEFLTKLFNLYIQSFLPLLLEHQLSMEAHGQNLLLVFDSAFQLTGLIYRDMGGVNNRISEADLTLPSKLRDPALSYFHNHVKDASNSIEHHFVWRGLFPLTKQLVKHAEYFGKTDARFNDWYQLCLSMHEHTGVLGNWTDGNPDSDLHQEELSVISFYRYGYVETLFGEMLINELERREVLDPETIDNLKLRLFCPEKITDDLLVPPCTYQTFFDETIKTILNALDLKFTHRSSYK